MDVTNQMIVSYNFKLQFNFSGPQLDKLEDLTNLAPFVPTDDLHQLGEFSWESLCPDFDFSDFYPNDLPCNPAPQINRRPQQIRDDWGYSQY
jgi:hypothetical protein